jgi:hypothetical protein
MTPTVPGGDPEQNAQFLEDAMLKSYAGDGVRITDDESRALEAERGLPLAVAPQQRSTYNRHPRDKVTTCQALQ